MDGKLVPDSFCLGALQDSSAVTMEIIISSLQQSVAPSTLLYIFFYIVPNLFLCLQLSDYYSPRQI